MLIDGLAASPDNLDAGHEFIGVEAVGQDNDICLGHVPVPGADTFRHNLYNGLLRHSQVGGVQSLAVAGVVDPPLAPQRKVGDQHVVVFGGGGLLYVSGGNALVVLPICLAGLGHEESSHVVFGVHEDAEAEEGKHPGDMLEQGLPKFGVWDVDGRDDPVLGAHKLTQMLGLVDNGRDDLRRRAAVAYQDDILARHVHVLSPFGGMEQRTLEGVGAGDIARSRLHQDSGSAKEELALVDEGFARVQVSNVHPPPFRLFPPLAAGNLCPKRHLALQIVLVGDIFQVLPELVGGGENLAPFGVWRKGKAVQDAGNIAGTSLTRGIRISLAARRCGGQMATEQDRHISQGKAEAE